MQFKQYILKIIFAYQIGEIKNGLISSVEEGARKHTFSYIVGLWIGG